MARSGHVKISVRDGFKGKYAMPHDLVIEIDGERVDNWKSFKFEASVRDVPTLHVTLHPTQVEVDARALRVLEGQDEDDAEPSGPIGMMTLKEVCEQGQKAVR